MRHFKTSRRYWMSFFSCLRVTALAGLAVLLNISDVGAATKGVGGGKQNDPCAELTVSYSYTPLYPERNKTVVEEVKVKLPILGKRAKQQQETDEPRMAKTIFVLKMIASL